MPFLEVLSRAVRSMNLPFGYRLTIWSSGAIAIDHFGPPSLIEVLLFVLGAIIAYLSCAVLTFRQRNVRTGIQPKGFTVINVFSVIAALAVSLVSRLPADSIVGYPVAGFIGTLTYILCLTGITTLAER